MTTPNEALEQARRLVAAGDLSKAVGIYRQLLNVISASDELWSELAIVHLRLQQLDSGIECLRRATELNPDVLRYHAMLGTALQMIKQPDQAVISFLRALEIGPPSAELHNNLALALKDARRTDAALRAYGQALALRPDYTNAHFNRGNLLLSLGRLAEAVEDFENASRLSRGDAAALCKLGIALYDMGRLDEALAAYERALQVQPDYPDVRRNRALIWLARGQYAPGWPEYEWRLECEDATKRSIDAPRWKGQSLDGQTLFVHAEQGLGDTLQFIRYVPLVREMGATVLVEVQSPLVPLISQLDFADSLVPPGSAPKCDFHSPLMSLAGLVPLGQGEPFWSQPYLKADSRLVAEWRERLSSIDGFRVGIAWAGNPDHPHDRFRSAQVQHFAPLAAVPGVHLINLQKRPASEQGSPIGGEVDILELAPELDTRGAFLDTAAVMQCLDLVITVDTAIAHLAGGLGVRVWTALDYSPDWRWLTTGPSTRWYPSMRLFRQKTSGDWTTVFAEMAGELKRTNGLGPVTA